MLVGERQNRCTCRCLSPSVLATVRPTKGTEVTEGRGMTINWNDEQKAAVEQATREHPPQSNQCLAAARKILPAARTTDSEAKARLFECGDEGLFLATKKSGITGGARWEQHVAVKTQAHVVDAMTGVPGTEEDRYLDAHFLYPDVIVHSDLEEVPEGLRHRCR